MDYAFWIPTLISIVAIGFSFFQQLKLANLNSKLEKNNFIHKLQFEKEFEIYSDLWIKLIDVRDKARALRPKFDSVDPNQPIKEIKIQRLSDLQQPYNSCLESFEKNKPFYNDKVYYEIEKILKIVRSEAVDYEYNPSSGLDYYDVAEKNISNILNSLDKISIVIRERINAESFQ